jgi:hypothetical protein
LPGTWCCTALLFSVLNSLGNFNSPFTHSILSSLCLCQWRLLLWSISLALWCMSFFFYILLYFEHHTRVFLCPLSTTVIFVNFIFLLHFDIQFCYMNLFAVRFVFTSFYCYLAHRKCRESWNVLEFSCVYFAFDIFFK